MLPLVVHSGCHVALTVVLCCLQVGKNIPTVAGLTQVDPNASAIRWSECYYCMVGCGAWWGNGVGVLSSRECACVCQGEVVTVANKALQSLCARGTNVLLEGRSQTVNYIRQWPHVLLL